MYYGDSRTIIVIIIRIMHVMHNNNVISRSFIVCACLIIFSSVANAIRLIFLVCTSYIELARTQSCQKLVAGNGVLTVKNWYQVLRTADTVSYTTKRLPTLGRNVTLTIALKASLKLTTV